MVAAAAPLYEVRSTTNEVSEALTRRWAVGPANIVKGQRGHGQSGQVLQRSEPVRWEGVGVG